MTAPAVVQVKTGSDAIQSSTNGTLAFDSSVTAGNLIIVFLAGTQNAPSNIAVTDNKSGNTYTPRADAYVGSSGDYGIAILTAVVVNGGASFTLTFGKSGVNCAVAAVLYEISGYDAAVIDGTAVSTSGTSGNSSVSMSATSFADDLLIQAIGTANTLFVSPGTPVAGWANDQVENNVTTFLQCKTAKRTPGATGTYTAGWASMTTDGSSFGMAAIAIKGVAAGGAIDPGVITGSATVLNTPFYSLG